MVQNAKFGLVHASTAMPSQLQISHVPTAHSALLRHSCAEMSPPLGHWPPTSGWHDAATLAVLTAEMQHASLPVQSPASLHEKAAPAHVAPSTWHTEAPVVDDVQQVEPGTGQIAPPHVMLPGEQVGPPGGAEQEPG